MIQSWNFKFLSWWLWLDERLDTLSGTLDNGYRTGVLGTVVTLASWQCSYWDIRYIFQQSVFNPCYLRLMMIYAESYPMVKSTMTFAISFFILSLSLKVVKIYCVETFPSFSTSQLNSSATRTNSLTVRMSGVKRLIDEK